LSNNGRRPIVLKDSTSSANLSSRHLRENNRAALPYRGYGETYVLGPDAKAKKEITAGAVADGTFVSLHGREFLKPRGSDQTNPARRAGLAAWRAKLRSDERASFYFWCFCL
jgi:hypothetical protein